MPRSNLIKLIIGILFVLAVALGLVQHKQNVKNLFGSNTTISHFNNPSADSLQGYYQKSQEIAGQQNLTQSATFLAAGDIMLSRNVALAIQKAKDADFPFRKMADVLKSTAFNFANLESPITQRATVGGHTMVFAASTSTAQGLNDYNFKILNLANNHAFDQGLFGLNYTYQTLDSLNISHMGTGGDLDQAWQPAATEANGINICFVGASYASANDGGKTTNNYVARMEDATRLKSAIGKARSECDFVVATMHGGTEYTRNPNKTQTDFARAAIDDGADMVIGAHPHWIQTIEKYCPLQSSSPLQGEVSRLGRDGGVGANLYTPTTSPASQGLLLKKEESSAACPNPKYIFYSLGNFIFDQNFSQETKEGLTLKITISKPGCSSSPPLGEMSREAGQRGCSDQLQGPRTPAKLESIELLPVIINNSQPRPATAEETKKILQKIGETENTLK